MRNKYGNKRVTSLCRYGYSHRSQLERAVCDLVWIREQAGEIEHLKHEHRIALTLSKIAYIADFMVRCTSETKQEMFIEAKGFESARWPIIRKLWRFYGPGPLEIWKGDYRRPRLDETIIPVEWVTTHAEETEECED